MVLLLSFWRKIGASKIFFGWFSYHGRSGVVVVGGAIVVGGLDAIVFKKTNNKQKIMEYNSITNKSFVSISFCHGDSPPFAVQANRFKLHIVQTNNICWVSFFLKSKSFWLISREYVIVEGNGCASFNIYLISICWRINVITLFWLRKIH